MDCWLEVEQEFSEGGKLEQMLAGRRLVDDLVLENPGEVVGDEDGVESGGEGWIDVGARAVADHPGVGGLADVVVDERTVGLVVLLGEDLDGGKVRGEAGALELVGLLGGVPLGDEDEPVAGGELGQGWLDGWKELDLVIGDGLGEAEDAVVLFGGDGLIGELFEAGDE